MIHGAGGPRILPNVRSEERPQSSGPALDISSVPGFYSGGAGQNSRNYAAAAPGSVTVCGLLSALCVRPRSSWERQLGPRTIEVWPQPICRPEHRCLKTHTEIHAGSIPVSQGHPEIALFDRAQTSKQTALGPPCPKSARPSVFAKAKSKNTSPRPQWARSSMQNPKTATQITECEAKHHMPHVARIVQINGSRMNIPVISRLLLEVADLCHNPTRTLSLGRLLIRGHGHNSLFAAR